MRNQIIALVIGLCLLVGGAYLMFKKGNPVIDPNKTATGSLIATNKTLKDDWQFSKPINDRDSFATPSVGVQSVGAPDSFVGSAGSSMKSKDMGFATGGAKDVNNFRENIDKGYLPLVTDVTYEGLYYDYYFDTGNKQECTKLFCPSYSQAVTADPIEKKPEYYLTVGLNSGMKESDFKRKKLNLVVVLDISGSMGSAFDSYYYDRFGNKVEVKEEKVESGKKKVQVASESVVAMLDHLNTDDRFGMVLFDDTAYLAKPLSLVGDTDMKKIKDHILEIGENGGTNMESGMKQGTTLFNELKNVNQDEYENRIIFLTDAMPNIGGTGVEDLGTILKNNSEQKIYTTFIGMGVDFNTELVEALTKIKGANYYSVHSSSEFKTRMDEEFDYMVTPLVFDLALNFESKGYKIEKVFGSPEANLATGELMRVNTLFPSKTTDEGTKGGIVLLKLTKISEDPLITLKTSYEDRSGKKDESFASINFENKNPESFDNNGIRKAVLLTRYANLMKDWILDERSHADVVSPWEPMVYRKGCIIIPPDDEIAMLGKWERQSMPLKVSEKYKVIFKDFEKYFTAEKEQTGDKDLSKEEDILKKLGK